MYSTFIQIEFELFLKNTWLPLQIVFLDSETPYWDLLFPQSHKPHKNIVILGGAFLKKSDLLR